MEAGNGLEDLLRENGSIAVRSHWVLGTRTAPSLALCPTSGSDKLHSHPSASCFSSLFPCNDCINPQYTNTPLEHLPEVPGITFLPSLAVSAAEEGTSAEAPPGTDLMGSSGLSLQTISHSISWLKNKPSN